MKSVHLFFGSIMAMGIGIAAPAFAAPDVDITTGTSGNLGVVAQDDSNYQATVVSDSLNGAFSGNSRSSDSHNVRTSDSRDLSTADSHNVRTSDSRDLSTADSHNVRTADSHNLRTSDSRDLSTTDSHNVRTTDSHDTKLVASQELSGVINNQGVDEIATFGGAGDGSRGRNSTGNGGAAAGYASGGNSINGNAFAAYAGIMNAAWNTGVNANTQAGTNIAAQGSISFGN